jgi:hypothetical protein
MPSRIASPVLVRMPPLQRASVGLGRYCSRICWLCSKPPAASTTPLRACTRRRLPSRSITAPVTRPSASVSSSTSCVRSHSGMLRSIIESRRRAIPAQPVQMRRERPHFSSHGRSSTERITSIAARFHQPGSCAVKSCASACVIAKRLNIHIMWCVSTRFAASSPSSDFMSGSGSIERCPVRAPGSIE